MKRGWFVPVCANFLIALGFALPAHAQGSPSADSAKPRPKVGLVLSGDGSATNRQRSFYLYLGRL
jgi:hypothetical protein